jgi:hypothetical protein
MKFIIVPGQVYFHFNDVFKFGFIKICFYFKDPSKKEILELLPSGGFFFRKLPTLAIHRINIDSARNYHLMDKEYIRGMVIGYSARNYHLIDEESTGRLVIPPEKCYLTGLGSSVLRKPDFSPIGFLRKR